MFKWMLCTKGTIWWRIKRVCSYFFLYLFAENIQQHQV